MSAEAAILPPQADGGKLLASEAGILGILIWLPDFAPARMAKVEREDFSDARHRTIFEELSALHNERKKAGMAGLIERLAEGNRLEAAGGRAYLVQLVDTACYGGAYMYDSYVAVVKDGRRVNSDRLPSVGGQSTAAAVGESVPSPAPDSLGPVGSEEATPSSHQPSVDSKAAVSSNQPAVARNESVEINGKASGIRGIDGAELLDDLKAVFERFVVLPPQGSAVLALWTLHTYAWRLRSVTTYLGVMSPEKRCGKTTLLMLLDKLVSRPQFASNISPPAIFRAIEETQPTLLIDEADTFLQGKDELRGMLNAGYTRESAYVLRATGEGQTLRRFSCWCPKVIASIGSLPETLADRCVIIRMRRKTMNEKCERLRHLDTLPLFDRCRRWVEQNEMAIQTAQPVIPSFLNDRAGDIWEPLLVLADLAGGGWPELARDAAAALTTVAGEQDLSSLLLSDIQKVFRVSQVDKLFSRYLVEALAKIPERPWREARRGGPINELWLAQHLSPFGIQSRSVRIGVCTGKGYCLADFTDAFARYLPQERNAHNQMGD